MSKFYFFKYRGRESQNPWSKLEVFGRQKLQTKIIIFGMILLVTVLGNIWIFNWQQKNQESFKQKVNFLNNLLQNPEQLKSSKNEKVRVEKWRDSLQWNYTPNELLLAIDKLAVELNLELQGSSLLNVDFEPEDSFARLKLELNGEFVQLGKFIQRLSVFHLPVLIEQLRLQLADENRLKAEMLLKMLN